MSNNWFKRAGGWLTALLLLTLFPVSAFASIPDKEELDAFVEDFMNREMKELHVPGAVVSIVQDGRTALLKGYGYADLERQVPADPIHSVFRLGSISKLFTATAAMQQYEAGRLDLNEDIKHYAQDLKIDYLDGEPITLHHLLTHTAGFYESFYALGRDKDKQLPLAEAIRRGLPGLVRKPGEQVAYSNQGMALAGYLVEKVAGKPYEQVVTDGILTPLRMTRTSFKLQESDSNLARSYSYSGGKYRPLPYAYIHLTPSGALNSTAEDMTRFMIAHLQRGRFDNVTLFSEQTADLMHRTQFSANSHMPGIAYDFFERYRNGLRLIEHDGGIDGFDSNLFLIPSQQTGIFLSTNSAGGGELTERFIGAYLDRFYPEKQDAAPYANPTPLKELRKMDGYYIVNRLHIKGPINFAQNLSASSLKAVKDGVVSFEGDRYAEIEPHIFRKENAHDLLYLDADKEQLVTSSIPAMFYERKPSYFHPYANIAILLGLAAIYPLHIVVAGARGIIGLIRRKRVAIDWPAVASSALFVVYFLFAVSTPDLFANEIPSWSYPLVHLPPLVLTALLLWMGIGAARLRRPSSWQIAYAAATAIFVLYMNEWGFFSV